MNDPREDQGDVLAPLANAFAALAVPNGPDDAVKQRVLVAMERQSNVSAADNPERTWRGWTMRKTFAVAAILLVMITVGGFLGSRPGSPGAAFAAMIDHIKEIQSVRFVMRTEFKVPDPPPKKDPNAPQDPPNVEMTITSMSPWVRCEATIFGQKVVRISNLDRHKTIMLFVEAKNFLLNDEKDAPADSMMSKNVVDNLRNLSKDGAKYFGTEKIDGVELMKYRYEAKGDLYTLWIDSATKLPIRISSENALDPDDASAGAVSMVFSNFEWDVPIDPGYFTLDPPAGYTLSPNAGK